MSELIQVQPIANEYQPGVGIVVPNEDKLKKELGLVDPEDLQRKEVVDPEVIKRAKDFIDKLVSVDPKDYAGRDLRVTTIKQQGREVLADLDSNVMLDEQIKTLATRAADGSEVANALIDLKMHVEELDPHKWDFNAGWFSRLMGRTPVVGKKVKKYLTQYEGAKTVIKAIVDSVEVGKAQIIRDNKTLRVRQIKLLEGADKLRKLIEIFKASDQELSERIAKETDLEKKKYMEEQLLFNIRQTLTDRLKSLNNKQMGILVFSYIFQTNEQLVRAVEYTNTTTLEALELAVTMRFALMHQKDTLDKVQSMEETATRLQEENAELMKTQGVEIYKQATGVNTDITRLKNIFQNINTAMDDIERFRKEALPKMASNVIEMYQMTEENAKRIQRVQEGEQARASFNLDLN